MMFSFEHSQGTVFYNMSVKGILEKVANIKFFHDMSVKGLLKNVLILNFFSMICMSRAP